MSKFLRQIVRPRNLIIGTGLLASFVTVHEGVSLYRNNSHKLWIKHKVCYNFYEKNKLISLSDILEKYHTPQMYERYLKIHSNNINDIPSKLRTQGMYDAYIKTNPYTLYFVPDRFINQKLVDEFTKNAPNFNLLEIPSKYLTEEICIRYFKKHPYSFDQIPTYMITQNICNIYSEITSFNLCQIPMKFRTQEVCDKYIKNDPRYDLTCIPKQFITQEMCNNYFKIFPLGLGNIPKHFITKEMCIEYAKNVGCYNLRDIPLEFVDQCLENLPKKYFTLEFINDFEGLTITGELFNKYFGHIQMLKLTNESETHHGLQYHDGQITDIKEFDRDKQCDNGIYFTWDPNKWDYLYDCRMKSCFTRKITVPNDTLVTFGRDKAKAHVVILDKRMPYENTK